MFGEQSEQKQLMTLLTLHFSTV